jgi:hypothetical protein
MFWVHFSNHTSGQGPQKIACHDITNPRDESNIDEWSFKKKGKYREV